MCRDAFDVLIIGKRGVVYKIHVGKHTNKRRNYAKPKYVIREEYAEP